MVVFKIKSMELEIIKHCDVSHEFLHRVVEIKNSAWPYPFESQLNWIKENQSPDDLHVILKDNDEDLAYMDLCPVIALVDNMPIHFMGVGNVCTKSHGWGHGGYLMRLINEFFFINKFHGLLFCKDSLVRFYAHYNWVVIPRESVSFEGELHDAACIMCFNTPPFCKIIYSDRFF